MTGSLDRHIGFAIRARRRTLDMSQEELARRTGCSLQQLHKYKYGISRVDAAMLLAFAKALSMPVAEFFAAIRFAGRS